MSYDDSQKSFGELPTLGPKTAPKYPPPPAEGIADDGRTDPARRLRRGDVILGRYVVEGELGQGGMSVVYACMDKTGGVRVAVKCLPPELGHNSVEMEEVRENFQLVVGLRHPCIAGVRTLERDERGEYFLVIDIAEGQSLRKWMRSKWKSGGITLAEAVPVLRQVASALDYAHGEKIIHRDVKPGNVMIDAAGTAKVLDFGLADQIRTSLSRASHVYRGTSGTAPYMAPEQWRGRQQNGQTDQYALGVMAYEMLAGHLPFENSDPTVLKSSVLDDPPEPIPGLPPKAMAALRRALAKQPEGRFATCGEFVEALAGGKTKTKSPGPKPKAGGWLVALALALAVGVGVWAWPKPGPKKDGLADNLKEEVYRLRPLAKAASEKAAAARYDRGQGFGGKLDEARDKCEQGDAALQSRDFAWAKKSFEASIAAAAWCESNAPLRKSALEAWTSIAPAKEKAAAMDGARQGAAAWQRAAQLSRDADAAFGEARFPDAEKGWKEAREAYLQSEADARSARIGQGLETARGAKGRKAWDEAVQAALGVLALDARNAEAKALKTEAEVERGLETARGAKDRKAWDEAAKAAEGVLALDARNAEAKELKAAAEGMLRLLDELRASAKAKADKVALAGYDRGQGFGEKLAEAKDKCALGEAAVRKRDFSGAKECFEASVAAAAWCEKNEPLRQSAAREREAAAAAREKAAAMDGPQLGEAAWRDAEQRSGKAGAAFERAEFRDAAAEWNGARSSYAQSERNALSAKVAAGLETARAAKRRKAWREVVEAASGVLALDAGNAEALELKTAAEDMLRPSILLTATLDGVQVAATVTEGVGGVGQHTPATVKLDQGGSYSFAVAYEAGGKKYAGRTLVKAKDEGVTPATLVLEEMADTTTGRTKTIVLPGGVELEMVWCPPGSFMMGSPPGEGGREDDETPHWVTLTEGFWIAKTELTEKQWRSVMGGLFRREQVPVSGVTWNKAAEFCRRAGNGLRLPTEAEWEYACRAGSTGAYAGELDRMGWYGEYGGKHLAGQKQPNAWGLYDMHGNLWEWCSDWYGAYRGGDETNPRGPASGLSRVLRGGAWGDEAMYCRSANRYSETSAYWSDYIGLRPCCSANPP